ncbi:MAG: DUF2510 domain-containing protein [Microbacteriaceae bacterium]|nr:MAG: DUF2510 domain-containing protein [Microbacteriaceae bacterium]
MPGRRCVNESSTPVTTRSTATRSVRCSTRSSSPSSPSSWPRSDDPMSSAQPTVAGWYPDPETGGTRYWDGSRWTGDVREGEHSPPMLTTPRSQAA